MHMMSTENIYIAEISSVVPKRYSAESVAESMYPLATYGSSVNKLARKFALMIDVPQRSVVTDLAAFGGDVPKVLSDSADHPRLWGKSIAEDLTRRIPKSEVGYFSLGYNLSFHVDTLPNLASQIVMEAALDQVERADELASYGCAASIFSIEQAIRYCRETNRAAMVITFDQCTVGHRHLKVDDPDFRRMMVTNLLFNDAAVGVLLIPESMRKLYDTPLLKIRDAKTVYRPGGLIGMRDGKFLMKDGVKDLMPKLVSDIVVRPMLEKNGLKSKDVSQWSIHQGGTEVLKQFATDEVLGLSDEQLNRSFSLFREYGNLSSPSCLMVLKSFFDQPPPSGQGHTGMMVGFGAGYYLGAMLYDWD